MAARRSFGSRSSTTTGNVGATSGCSHWTTTADASTSRSGRSAPIRTTVTETIRSGAKAPTRDRDAPSSKIGEPVAELRPQRTEVRDRLIAVLQVGPDRLCDAGVVEVV